MISNNRAQFFGFSLVITVLIMGGVAFAMYTIQNKNLHVSLVSPRAVLDVQDELLLFEVVEQNILRETLSSLGTETFGTEEFLDELHKEFVDNILKSEEMKAFIFEDLHVDGKDMEGQARLIEASFISNRLYSRSGIEFVDGEIIVERARIGKHMFLQSSSTKRNTFPVDFYFEYEKKYVVKLEENKYHILEVK